MPKNSYKLPLHPLLVHAPIGLWLAALVSDLLYMLIGSSHFATVSYYCILFGMIGAILAAPTGWIDFVRIPLKRTEPRRLASLHMSLNFFAIILYTINFFSRHGLENGVPTVITQGEVLLSVVALAVLSYSGYLGGLMVYEHGVGVNVHLPQQSSTDNARPAA